MFAIIRPILPCCVSILFASVCGIAQETGKAEPTGQTVTETRLVDHDYRFMLTAQSGWRIYGEKLTRAIRPDSVATIARPARLGGGRMSVTVEHAPDADLEKAAHETAKASWLEDSTNEGVEATKLAGLPAFRVRVRGKSRDVDLRYEYVLAKRGEYLYQLECWDAATPAKPNASTFRPLVESFALVPGEIRPRQNRSKAPDTVGVGWRISNGRYESAAYGLAVDPKPGCHLIVGAPLVAMDESAAVGIDCNETYLTVIAEQTHSVDREQFAKSLTEAMASVSTDTGRVRTITLDKRDVTFRVYEQESRAITILHGVTYHGNVCMQIQAWHRRSRERHAKAALPALMGSIRFLDSATRQSLADTLSKTPDPTNAVGSNESFRQGTYRNFEHGWSWKRPAGFWSAAIGQAARTDDASTVLLLQEHSAGIFASVTHADHDGTLQQAHEQSTSSYEATPGAPKKCTIGGRPALVSDVPVEHRGNNFVFRVHTLLWQKRAWIITAWGLAGNMASAVPSITAMRKGFRFHAGGLSAGSQDESGVVDHRFGFELLSPQDDAVVTDLMSRAPAIMRGVRLVAGGDAYIVIALCPEDGRTSLESFSQLTKLVMKPAADRHELGKPRESQGTLDGLPCIHRQWDSSGGYARVSLLKRDGTFFAYFVTTDTEAKLEEANALFSFLP